MHAKINLFSKYENIVLYKVLTNQTPTVYYTYILMGFDMLASSQIPFDQGTVR